MIETFDLTPAHVGLGDLTEFAALTLVANAHYRVLTEGTGATPRGILDKAGAALYPSIFALEVRASGDRPIESFPLWEPVAVGADVRMFGRSFLDVRGALGRGGELPGAPEQWDGRGHVSVRWAGAWTHHGEVAMPAPSFVGHVPKAPAIPELLARFRTVQARGTLSDRGPEPRSLADAPTVLYPVVAGRDVARGRQMMFSQFVVVMDHAEREVLTERLRPAFPRELADCRTTLERTIFYFGNCRADDVVETSVEARLERGVPSADGDSVAAPGVVLRVTMELVEHRSKRLLALAEAKKGFAIPPELIGLTRDLERMVARHGTDTPMKVGSR